MFSREESMQLRREELEHSRWKTQVEIRKWAVQQAAALTENERFALGGVEGAAKAIETYVRG